MQAWLFKSTYTWLFALLILFSGSLNTLGLVLCLEPDGNSKLEFKTVEGDCVSCPDSEESRHSPSASILSEHGCGCTDIHLATNFSGHNASSPVKLPDAKPVLLFFSSLAPLSPVQGSILRRSDVRTLLPVTGFTQRAAILLI